MTSFLILKLVIYSGLLLFLSYYFVYKTITKLLERRRIKTTGESVQALVTDYKTLKDSAGAYRYYPILQYTIKNGESITVQSKKERAQKYEIGKQLTIYYLPENPSEFYIDGLLPYIKITSIVLGFSASCLMLFEIFKMLRKMF